MEIVPLILSRARADVAVLCRDLVTRVEAVQPLNDGQREALSEVVGKFTFHYGAYNRIVQEHFADDGVATPATTPIVLPFAGASGSGAKTYDFGVSDEEVRDFAEATEGDELEDDGELTEPEPEPEVSKPTKPKAPAKPRAPKAKAVDEPKVAKPRKPSKTKATEEAPVEPKPAAPKRSSAAPATCSVIFPDGKACTYAALAGKTTCKRCTPSARKSAGGRKPRDMDDEIAEE